MWCNLFGIKSSIEIGQTITLNPITMFWSIKRSGDYWKFLNLFGKITFYIRHSMECCGELSMTLRTSLTSDEYQRYVIPRHRWGGKTDEEKDTAVKKFLRTKKPVRKGTTTSTDGRLIVAVTPSAGKSQDRQSAEKRRKQHKFPSNTLIYIKIQTIWSLIWRYYMYRDRNIR